MDSELIKLIGERDIVFITTIKQSLGGNVKDVDLLINNIIKFEENINEKTNFIKSLVYFKNTFFPFIKQSTDEISSRLDFFISNFKNLSSHYEIVNGIKLLNIVLNNYKYHFIINNFVFL